MVGQSECLIAMVSDMRSGTGQTVRLAKQQGLMLRLITLDRALEHASRHSTPQYYC